MSISHQTFFFASDRGGKKICQSMDKLKLTGQNLGRFFNSICVCSFVLQAIMVITKTAWIKVEKQPQQLLGYLLFAFMLPGQGIFSLV